jgi:hypothetical protein
VSYVDTVSVVCVSLLVTLYHIPTLYCLDVTMASRGPSDALILLTRIFILSSSVVALSARSKLTRPKRMLYIQVLGFVRFAWPICTKCFRIVFVRLLHKVRIAHTME